MAEHDWKTRAVTAELKLAGMEVKMDKLRKRASDTVSKASTVASTAKKMAEEATERADKFEVESAQLRNEIKRVKEIMSNGGLLDSELEKFLLEIPSDSKLFKYIKRIIVRSFHPDKHQKQDKQTRDAMNELMRIFNTILEV